jgi:hypothetical protein
MKSVHPIYRVLACWSVALLAGVGAWAQAPQMPKVPDAAKPTPAAIPKAPATGDLPIGVYLRLREPNQVIDRLAAWSTMFEPTATAESLRSDLALIGINTTSLTPGHNFAIFFQREMQGANGPPFVLSIPIKSDDPGLQKIKTNAPEVAIKADGGDTLAGTTSTLAKFEGKADALRAIRDAAMKSDVQAYVDVQGLMQTYSALVQQSMQSLAALVTMAGGPAGGNASGATKIGAELQYL